MRAFYRLLLLLYPPWFRREYGQDLTRDFVESTRGRSRANALRMAVADVVPNALMAWWDLLRRGGAGMVRTDLRVALRQIRRTPLFSAVVIAVIGLGIGINAGLLTTLDVYVWRPAPAIAPDDRLVRLTATIIREEQQRPVLLSLPEIRDLRQEHRIFTDVAGWYPTSIAVDFGGGPETVVGFHTSANFFRLLRVPMAAGTGFSDDADIEPIPVAVIGHSLWMSHFEGSAAAIGSTIRVMNQPFTVVGVVPPQFVGVDVTKLGSAAIWLPLGARGLIEPGFAAGPGARDRLAMVARLAPGVRTEDVGRLAAAVAARLERETPATRQALALWAGRLTGMDQRDSGTREFLIAVGLVAALIVVITCSNVSALLLGRAAARRHEVGVRLSLGATRFRIVRQVLTESLVYAMAGALLGLGLYTVCMQVAYATIPGILPGLEARPATFVGAAALALVTTFGFGLAPALHASRAGIGEVIKNSGPQAMRRSRMQAGLVVIQLASSQPVLIITSLVLIDLRDGPRGAGIESPASVVTMQLDLFRSRATGIAPEASGISESLASLTRIQQQLKQVSGVESVAIASDADGEWFETPGATDRGGGRAAEIRQVWVTSDYLALQGFQVLQGGTITSAEDRPGSTALVVNAAAARRFWPDENPVGNLLLRHAREPEGRPQVLEVIGVVGSMPRDPNPDLPMVFAPMATAEHIGQPTVIVRMAGDAGPLVPQLKRAIGEVEPYAGVSGVRTLAEIDADRRRESTQANAAALAVGVAALVLASLGLYAIIALAVAQRTREIGVRLAVGATPATVVRMFLGHGLKVSLIGLAIGLPLTVAGIRLVQASVVGFSLEKVVAVLMVVPVLIGVAGLASWLPARRAGGVDPLVALRTE